MENRLSDSFVADSLDAGHQNLPWEPGTPSGFLTGIDIDALLSNPDAAEVVPHLPAQALYYALKRKGLDECLDLLPLLSPDQVERMLDFEAWTDDALSPKKLFQFMKVFGEVSREQLYERFSELDEEYQLGALQGMFRVYEYETSYDLPESLQDSAYAMPCGKVYYQILSEDPDEIAFIEELIEAAKENNLRYAYSLIAHAAYIPPAEQAADVARFRRGRLEDDGFVSYDESQAIFVHFDRQALAAKWAKEVPTEQSFVPQRQDHGLGFLDEVFLFAREQDLSVDELYQIHQGFLYLANALCAATRVEPEDVAGLNRLLEQSKAILSLGLEHLAQGSLELGLKILRTEVARTLFQTGLSLVDDLRTAALEVLVQLQWPGHERLLSFFKARKWGHMQLELDRNWVPSLGLEASEILKGLFNRFPMVPMRTMQDQNRIIFAPIDGAGALGELAKNVEAILGYMQVAAFSGLPLQQPLELLIREMAIAELRAAQSEGDLESRLGIQDLLKTWHGRLERAKQHWFIGKQEELGEILAIVMDMVQDELHGLIVLPGSDRRQQNDFGHEVPL